MMSDITSCPAGLCHLRPHLAQHFTHKLPFFPPWNLPWKVKSPVPVHVSTPDVSPHDTMSGLLRCHVGGPKTDLWFSSQDSMHFMCQSLNAWKQCWDCCPSLPGKPNWADDKWHGCCLRGRAHSLLYTVTLEEDCRGPLYTPCNSTFPTRVSHVFLSWPPYMQFWCTKEGKTITINKASIWALNKNLEWFWS